jgi:hypothetical protein
MLAYITYNVKKPLHYVFQYEKETANGTVDYRNRKNV